MSSTIGLYVHWPFCTVRCGYCAFFTRVGKEHLLPRYVSALIKELKLYKSSLSQHQIGSIYLGGGTPSLVAPIDVSRFMQACRQELSLTSDCELTIEANPESLTPEKLETYLSLGIQRLSLGMQASQDTLLKRMGRLYTNQKFIDQFNLARSLGFKNIGTDLIFGLPDQTMDQWEESLDQVISLQPEHVSCYSLQLDKDSAWTRLAKQGFLNPAPEDADRDMYEIAKESLGKNGWQQYEISNWSQPNFESHHNLSFWQGNEYLGIGAGAYSRFEGKHWHNVESIETYCELLEQSQFAYVNVVHETSQDRRELYILLGLRLIQGIDLAQFKARFGQSLVDLYQSHLQQLVTSNLLELTPTHLSLTNKGLDVADKVTELLMT